MPEISLNVYENEIDQLIEQARYLEALTHVRHILGQYPHYAGAYYLLGKVMLEVDLPGLAVDVFRRALSADPEHLMARIGLGLSHERANNLDASIWNLERALELEPSNNDLDDELRRMYGRRDGVEPDYITQTRAGLARLYIRGDRPGRAVIELQKLLDEAPGRPDLMTALAEAYWADGQLVKASEMCQEILDKMPFNCKANLLLGTLWVNSGQEEGWVYLNRAQEVDLANAMSAELFGGDSLLELQEVTLDRLVYDPDALDVDQSSAWFKRLESASISAGISEAPPEMTESEVRLVDITAGLESQIEIPDWLRELSSGEDAQEAESGELGWMADVGTATEIESPERDQPDLEGEALLDLHPVSAEPDAEVGEPVSQAEDEAPEWLQELTTQEVAFDLDESESAPDWLLELVGEEAAEAPVSEGDEVAAGATPAVRQTDSDWLKDFASGEETPSGVVSGEVDLGGDEVAVEADADWLAGLAIPGDEATSAEAGAEGELTTPDWLSELQSTVSDTDVTDLGEQADDLASGEVPDWLRELEPTPEQRIASPEEATAPVSEVAEDEVPDWLEELQTPGVVDLGLEFEEPIAERPSESLDAEPAPAEEVPEWLRDFGEVTQTPEAETTVVSSEEEADWLTALIAEEPEEDQTIVAVSPDAEPTEAPDAVAETLSPVDESLLLPDEGEEVRVGDAALAWLDSLTAEHELPHVEVEDASIDVTVESVPAESETEAPVIAEPDEFADLMSGDDALAWLESLAVGKEEELRAQAEAESEARVAEILGRKPSSPEKPVVEADSVVEPSSVPEQVVAQAEPSDFIEVAETVGEDVESAAVESEEGLLSGDDALAWLESLAAGKEEELRAQAEAESEARVAQILGRERKPETGEVVETEPEPALAAETEIEPEPISDELEVGTETVSSESAEFAEPESPSEDIGEISSAEAMPVIAEPKEVAPGESEVDAGVVDDGEDALTWLAELAPEVEADLQAQISEPVEEDAGEDVAYFGWSAFGETPQEVSTTEDGILPKDVAVSEPEQEKAPVVEEMAAAEPAPVVEEAAAPREIEPAPEAAPLEADAPEVAAPRTEVAAPPEPVPSEVTMPEAAAPEPPVPEAEAPEAVPAEDIGEGGAEAGAPQESRREAQVSEATGEDLDEMRAYVKKKRSDHTARLTLARALWQTGEVQESMQHYGKLIKSSAKTDDVLEDLEAYVASESVRSSVMRTLGDAYMKFGELEKALEIYNRAMDML